MYKKRVLFLPSKPIVYCYRCHRVVGLWSPYLNTVFQYLGSSSDWLKPGFIQSEALPRSYVLYHPIHSKSRPDGRKILFHKYAAKANQSRKSPLPHEIRTLARDRKAWKRMEVDCWHHRESPSVPRKDRESMKILRSLLRRHLKGKAVMTVTKCWIFFQSSTHVA